MTQLQFASQSYRARSLPLDAQRLVNMFTEPSPGDAKSTVPVYMCPGLSAFSRLGTGPIWGLHFMSHLLYAVSGNQLFSINEFGLATLIGTTNLSGLVSMADNELQLVIVDGNVGWVYQPAGLNQVSTVAAMAGDTSITVASTGTIQTGDTFTIPLDAGGNFTTTVSAAPTGNPNALTVPLAAAIPSTVSVGAVCVDPAVVLGQIQQEAFMPAATVVYFDSFFVFDAAGTNQWFISGEGDGTQYNGLDFASAQANPDFVRAVVNYHEQLLIYGSKSIEVWYDAGAVNFPFQRFDGAYIQRGLASAHATAQEDNTVFWLGEDGIFYRLNVYQPVRISTFATEHAWAQYPRITDANCFVITMEGHKFLFLNFPSGNATWCYDISSGTQEPLWHERESLGTPWV